MPAPAARPEPTRPQERIEVIDILRGFAIFGILLVNMIHFAQPVYREVLDLGPWPHPADRAASFLIAFFAEAKFFTLFSMLFGLGLALQMGRAAAKGVAVVPLYARRLAILLVFGLAHAFLFWWGDILTYYAVLGFLLIPFRNLAPRRLLAWAAAFLAVPVVVQAALTGLVSLANRTTEGAARMEAMVATSSAQAQAAHDRALEVYRGGDFLAMIPQRVADWSFATSGVLLNGMLFVVFAMFLIGLYVGKRGVLADPAAHATALRRVALWGTAVGVAGTAAYLALVPSGSQFAPTWANLLGIVGWTVGSPALSMGYASALVLWTRRPRARARLRPLAAVGRTALSNYLLQTLVLTTLFYGYGGALYGRMGPAAGLVLAFALFALQLLASRWWVARFRFGPFEWAWRSLTYGRLQPIRRDASPATAPSARAPRGGAS